MGKMTDAIIKLRINSKITRDKEADRNKFRDISENISRIMNGTAKIMIDGFEMEKYEQQRKKLCDQISVADRDDAVYMRDMLADVHESRIRTHEDMQIKTEKVGKVMDWFNSEAKKLGQPEIFNTKNPETIVDEMTKFANELGTLSKQYIMEYDSKLPTKEKMAQREEMLQMTEKGDLTAQMESRAVIGMASMESKAQEFADMIP